MNKLMPFYMNKSNSFTSNTILINLDELQGSY